MKRCSTEMKGSAEKKKKSSEEVKEQTTETSLLSRQTLTSLSNSVSCLMSSAHARCLSNIAHCLIVTSVPVVRQCLIVDRVLQSDEGSSLMTSSCPRVPRKRTLLSLLTVAVRRVMGFSPRV